MKRRILREKEVLEITGLSRSTLRRRVEKSEFPQPVHLGTEDSRAIGWRSEDVYDWIDSLPYAA